MPSQARFIFPCIRLTLLSILVLVILMVSNGNAQWPYDVKVTVGDTTAMPNETNTVISVYMTNYEDTISGYNLWILFDRPGLVKFQTDSAVVVDTSCWECIEGTPENCLDSIHVSCVPYWECLEWGEDECVDSVYRPGDTWDIKNIVTDTVLVGNHDTTGTLTSGFEYVNSLSISGQGTDVNIAAVANWWGGPPAMQLGILPQQDGLLIKVLADVEDVDTSVHDRTVNMIVQHEFIDHFSLSNPHGDALGVDYELYDDTLCWKCNVWAGEDCVEWRRVPTDSCDFGIDSTVIRPDSTAFIDTNLIRINDGSVTILIPSSCPQPRICGDCNGDGYHLADISDLTFLIDYLFAGGPQPNPIPCCDLNCSKFIDISDLTLMVDYLFGNIYEEPCEACP